MNVDQSVHNDQIQVYLTTRGKRFHFAGRARDTPVCTTRRPIVKQRQATSMNARRPISRLCRYEGATAMIVIPWATLGGRPEPGETCGFNAFYRKGQLSRIWEHNLYQKTWRNLRDEVGILEF